MTFDVKFENGYKPHFAMDGDKPKTFKNIFFKKEYCFKVMSCGSNEDDKMLISDQLEIITQRDGTFTIEVNQVINDCGFVYLI